MYKILISGSRRRSTVADRNLIGKALAIVVSGLKSSSVLLVHGDAAGTDSTARDLWKGIWKLNDKAFPYEKAKRKAGGPSRNTKMVQFGADICLVFPDEESKGTWDLHRKAKAAGIPTFVITSTEDLQALDVHIKEQNAHIA
jgi:hypothetical protein